MKKTARILSLVLTVCLMTGGIACAESLTFSGIVVPAETIQIKAPIGGNLDRVFVKAGDRVAAGTTLATLEINRVYAAADGTVTAVYGQPGDDAESVTTQYGACIYMEGDLLYSISGSTSSAYSAAENKIIHSGETVYLRGRSDAKHTGTGIVTSVSGSSYTVNVTGGSEAFSVSESVDIFRDPAFTAVSRIGRGSISRVDPTAVTSTGTIVSYAVRPGDRVKRGALLMETATGVYDNLNVTGTEIRADRDLVIAEVSVAAGTAVNKGDIVLTAYPADRALAEVTVNECDLMYIQPGDRVSVELVWNQDSEVRYDGTVTAVSYIGEIGEESTTYKAYAEFVPDAGTRFNMTAEIAVRDEEAPIDEDTDNLSAEE